MTTTYKTKGTCSKSITIDVKNDVIGSVSFESGCDGNLKGVAKLVEGLNVRTAADKLRGITCGKRSTSCPDQLAQALDEIAAVNS
ncbi:MAG: TIGR03905 family TSCPD domain-containing protein [Oscillospiraceae bacterium]|jgi:uncharacterized protein (TIGR03905 family)|nr:TIGR03905 family TSCPD domain-containing protein [Oscillospiraceae bacterium]